MRSISIVALLLSLSVSSLMGCSGASAQDDNPEDDSAAVTADEASKKYEFAELLLPDAPASPEVRKLGAVRWAVYSAVKGRFMGLVMFAIDRDNDVKYALLVNATRAADGKSHVLAFELDKAGKETKVIDAATFRTLASESKPIGDLLAARTRSMPNTAAADCTIGITRISIGVLAGFAVIWVGATAVTMSAAAIEFEALLMSLPVVVQAGADVTVLGGLGAAATAAMFGSASVYNFDSVDTLVTQLKRCGE